MLWLRDGECRKVGRVFPRGIRSSCALRRRPFSTYPGPDVCLDLFLSVRSWEEEEGALAGGCRTWMWC